MNTSQCSSCGADIIWRHTQNGKRMPLDATPIESWKQGAYVLDGAFGCLPAAPLTEAGKPIFMNHFATCPTAHVHKTKGDR